MGRGIDWPGAYSNRAVHAFRTSVQPAEIRIFRPWRTDGTTRRMGCIPIRCPSFAGILPDERRFLFRNADSDVGCRNGRLSLTGRLCCRYGASRGDRRMDIGIQRCRDRGFLQPDADDSKMAYTDCRNAFYCRRYLLRYNLFLLKR